MLARAAPEDLPVPDLSPPTLDCPSCGHGNPVASRFCNQCGMPIDFRSCAACDAINAPTAERCHKCDTSFVAPIFPAPATVTPVAPTQASQSPRVLITLLALLGLVVLLFFAYQDNPEPVEPVALTLIEPTPAPIGPQPLAIDTQSDARLAAYTRAVPVKAKPTALKQPAPRKAPIATPINTKPKPVRSLRAP